MHTDTLDQAVARVTGDDIATIRRLGFYIILQFGRDPMEGAVSKQVHRREAREYFNNVLKHVDAAQ